MSYHGKDIIFLQMWRQNKMHIQLNKLGSVSRRKRHPFPCPLFTKANNCFICVIIHSGRTDWLLRQRRQSKTNIRKWNKQMSATTTESFFPASVQRNVNCSFRDPTFCWNGHPIDFVHAIFCYWSGADKTKETLLSIASDDLCLTRDPKSS